MTIWMLFCSGHPRSIESARRLGMNFESDPIFREHDLPVAPLPWIKLPTGAWDLIGKALWISGCSPEGESFAKARARARAAASKLAQRVREQGPVMLVGHGFFNLFIDLELRRLGLLAERDRPFSHWGHRKLWRPA